jgi:hypothetical protein
MVFVHYRFLASSIHPVAGAAVDPQLRDPLAGWLHIAHEAQFEAEDPRVNAVLGLLVLETVKPLFKVGGFRISTIEPCRF